MKKFILFAFFFVLCLPAFSAMKGSAPPRKGGKSVFPSYPAHAAGRPPMRADSIGNHVTTDHLQRVQFADNRAGKVMHNDPHVTNTVLTGRAHYVNAYQPEFQHREAFINAGVHHYNTILIEHPVTVGLWHRHYFYGGFYYGFHPILNMDVYFYNPMVYWFYSPAFDDYYYRRWYDTQYDAYPELRQPFPYHGLYYPTENLKQLLFGVSAMPMDKQVAFREAITLFTKKLAQNMANALGTHVHLANGDVAVTHYEIMGYDDAIDLEGFVTFNGQEYNFKSLLDLKNPSATDVVAPVSLDKEPTTEQLKALDDLNTKMSSIQGTSGNPSAVPQPASAGDVNADPASPPPAKTP